MISLLPPHEQGLISPAELAVSALQYLPTPLVVLNSVKTVVLANEAMARLLGVDETDEEHMPGDDRISALHKLRGQTLSQLGIALLQDGRPVWVVWESFLDGIGEKGGSHVQDYARQSSESDYNEGDVTPTAERAEPLRRTGRSRTNHSSTIPSSKLLLQATIFLLPPSPAEPKHLSLSAIYSPKRS